MSLGEFGLFFFFLLFVFFMHLHLELERFLFLFSLSFFGFDGRFTGLDFFYQFCDPFFVRLG